MTVLESGKSQLLNLETETSSQLEQHIDETAVHLNDLLTTVQDKKETVNNIKEIAHPCGGPGWETVVYLDFRDLNTPCPNGTNKTGYTPERPIHVVIYSMIPMVILKQSHIQLTESILVSVDVLRHTNQDKVLHSFFTIITVLISMSHI